MPTKYNRKTFKLSKHKNKQKKGKINKLKKKVKKKYTR